MSAAGPALRCADRSPPLWSGRRGPVAQLDRALPSEGRGREFESRRVRQQFQALRRTAFQAHQRSDTGLSAAREHLILGTERRTEQQILEFADHPQGTRKDEAEVGADDLEATRTQQLSRLRRR